MMSDPCKESEFVQELLAEGISDNVREKSLKAMLAQSTKQHRQKRLVRRVGAAMALAAFSVLLFMESEPPDQKLGTNPIVASMMDGRRIEGTPIRVLSDEDLFALFPKQSLGVVGTDDDFQLVFLDQSKRQMEADGASRHPEVRP